MAHAKLLFKVFTATVLLFFFARWLSFNERLRRILTRDVDCANRIFQRAKQEKIIDGVQRSSGLMANFTDKILKVLEQMDDKLKEEKQSFVSFLSQPVINNHDFDYLLNPTTTCLDSETEILIVVPSAPGNFQQRLGLRRGECGKYAGTARNKAKLLFFIGLTNLTDVQSKIDEEYGTFQDIVQESFEDAYKNIRLKAVSMLKWASVFCQRAKYVIRNDDDISMNMTSVVESVKRARLKYPNFIAGRVRENARPARNVKNKVYLSEREFPGTSFPPFALGGLLGYPMLTVELLYQAALRVEPIWLDDVYITGICAQRVGAKLINDSAFMFKHNDIGNWAQ